MSEAVLYDVQGPRARRRVLLGSVVAGLLLLGLLAVVAVRLEANGQFDARLYRPFLDEPLFVVALAAAHLVWALFSVGLR